ncbi:MAG: hypothetical protein V3W18_09345 [candidate division Zixibacteria bacterium]
MTTRNRNRILIIMISAFVAVYMLWSPAEAKKKKQKKSKSKQVLFLDVGLRTTYDENIIRYSDADLDLYDISGRPDKFSIKSKDDWIISPDIEARLKGKFIKSKTAWIGLNYRYYYYAQNDVRRFQKISVFGRHYFMRGGYLELEYSYLPDYYYRNQFDQDQGIYIDASFSKHSFKFETGLDITSSLKGDISYRYQSKTFNPEVSERDLTVNGLRLDGIWRASKTIKFWAYYGLQRANADGADIPDLDIKDVSYDAWDITLGTRYYSKLHKKMKPEFFSTLQIREIKFRTTKYRDIYRFDREDRNFRFRVGTALRLFYKIRFDIYYTYQQKRVDLPAEAYEGLLEYKANSVSFGFKRSF